MFCMYCVSHSLPTGGDYQIGRDDPRQKMGENRERHKRLEELSQYAII